MIRSLLIVLLLFRLSAEDCSEALAQSVLVALREAAATAGPDSIPDPLTPLRDLSGPRCDQVLRHACRSSIPGIRAAAVARCIRGELRPETIRLADDPDPDVRAAAITARLAIDRHSTLNALRPIVSDRDPSVRAALADGLVDLGWPAADDPATHAYLDLVRRLAADDHPQVRIAAITAAAAGGTDEARTLVQAACLDPDEGVVLAAIDLLDDLLDDPTATAGRLIDAYARLGSAQRLAANLALAEFGDLRAVPLLCRNLAQSDPDLLATTMDALVRLPLTGEDAAIINRRLPRLLAHQTWWVRASAVDLAGRCGDAKILRTLVQMLPDDDAQVAQAAQVACRNLSGQPFTDPQRWREWLREEPEAPLHHRGPADRSTSVATFCSIEDRFTSVLYVIDTSGSMAQGGELAQYRGVEFPTKLNAAKRELLRSVMSLAPETRFNVLFFSSRVRTWRPGSVRATWRTKAALSAALADVEPRGGTATLPSLLVAFAQEDAEAAFFLTDGMPTIGERDPQGIIAAVARANDARPRGLRLHTIAFCIEEARALLEALAHANGGQYQLVK